ncbi:erythromycin biosynthesis sensory transduction protein eryC1 [bacterium]|nr:MAG: erythromycin biosynthesis sensory transduction protein eryC1 [bacterium]
MRTDIKTVPFLDLAAQNTPLLEEVQTRWAGILENNAFILGPAVRDFEGEFASFCDAPHAVGVNSGTSALQLMIAACGIGPGDEVITVPNTFIATTEAIAAVGAVPVLVDVDPQTWLMDCDLVESRISERTKALLPVHLYGHCCDLDRLRGIADKHGLFLLEDAAQAHGARWNGQRIGRGSHAAAFSFYPGKNLGAFGDGGAVITNSLEVADHVRALRHHGQSGKNVHAYVGVTGRLDSLQAAVLSVKLPHLDGWNARRREHAELYRELLAGSRFKTPVPLEGSQSVYHLFVVNHPEAPKVRELLSEHGIQWGMHYPAAVHLQPAFESLGQRGDFPVAESICDNIISLPMFAELDEAAVRRVCEVLLMAEV